MFYRTQIKDHIRVPPSLFNLPKEQAVLQRIRKDYEGFISKDIGIVIDIAAVLAIEDGIIILGDGAAYYPTTFELLVFRPELQEVILGKIKDIADFGAFITLGPIEGMIHVSQAMDDFVSFGKEKVLSGKESKKTLKIGDKCRARIIAVSFKEVTNPKLGLTMRQQSLGKLEWLVPQEGGKEDEQSPKEQKKGGRNKP